MQYGLRLSTEPDPHWCASIVCRTKQRRKATHAVLIDKRTFPVCNHCARKYESVRGCTVAALKETR